MFRVPQECSKAVLRTFTLEEHSLSRAHFLATIFRAFATVSATFTALLAQETTAQDCQAGHQASAVLLLLRWGLLGRRLLVAHLLRGVAILLGRRRAVALGWVATLGRAGACVSYCREREVLRFCGRAHENCGCNSWDLPVGLLRVLGVTAVVALACHFFFGSSR